MATNEHLKGFMEEFGSLGLTFDDVSLITQYSDFLPSETDISTRLTRNIHSNIPFLSAAMDTVTESRMAIAMAMLGGVGVIHKNMEAREQANQVAKVKHHLNGLIADPITFCIGDTIEYLQAKCAKKKYGFTGFPVIDENDRLAGILTARDLRFAPDKKAKLEDVMTRDVITAPSKTDLKEAHQIMQENKIGKLPLTEGGRLTGLYSFSDVHSLIKNDQPLYNRDEEYQLLAAAAIGPDDQERATLLNEEEVDILVVDTAHGHSAGVIEMTKWVKNNFPHIEVIAGNIATGDAAADLLRAGADAVKVGIGPGSICTTRVVAGVGVPQISAIYESARALQGEIPVIADGGIRHSGDVSKAIAAGANSVMMGSVLAGTEEGPGEKIISQGRQYVIYRGMGSLDAMKSRSGSRQRYGQDDVNESELVPQGIEGMVPYAGNIQKVINQFSGGLRAGLGYCGCRDLRTLKSKGRFTRVSHSAVIEAHPHDIKITKEAPNYRS